MKLRFRVGKGTMPISPPGAWVYNLPAEWGDKLWVIVSRVEPGEFEVEI